MTAVKAASRGDLPAVGHRGHEAHPTRQIEASHLPVSVGGTRLVLCAILALITVAFTVLAWVGLAVAALWWLMLAAAVTVVCLAGPVLWAAAKSVRRGVFDQHTFMAMAVIAGLLGAVLALLRPQVPGADFLAATTLIVTCHLWSIFLSGRLRSHTARSFRRLVPPPAPIVRMQRGGRHLRLPAEDLAQADLVQVLPGETVPADGHIVEGSSAVNQALPTGRAESVRKVCGDQVLAGSRNLSATLAVRVTQPAHQALMVQIDQSAKHQPGSTPNPVERVLRVYRWLVAAVAIGAVLWWTVGALLVTGQADFVRAAVAGLSVVVFGYPAAVFVAGPLTIMGATALAAARCVLFRTGGALQRLAQADMIVLDKTGTLTQAAPFVVAAFPATGVTKADLLRSAAAVEVCCEHPLASAIVARANADGLRMPLVTDVVTLPGQGVRGRIGGQSIVIGKPGAPVELGGLAGCLERMRAAAITAVLVTADGKPLGLIGIAAPIKPCAAATVTGLHLAGVGTVMMTGDHERVAAAIAGQTGISVTHAETTPEGKATLIRQLQRAGHRVAMVGDGLNDIAALRQADVGIAIGCVSERAMHSAQVILAGPKMAALLDAHDVAVRYRQRIRQNVGIAAVINIGVVLTAAVGLLVPGWLLATLVISVTAVLINAMRSRLLRFGVWRCFADLPEPVRPNPNQIPI